jgi:hypothetical protein
VSDAGSAFTVRRSPFSGLKCKASTANGER